MISTKKLKESINCAKVCKLKLTYCKGWSVDVIQRHKPTQFPLIPFKAGVHPFYYPFFRLISNLNFYSKISPFLLFVIFHLFLNFIFTEKIAPAFTVNPPVQMLISSGGKASMTCKASGFPIPLITWFKDGIPVPRANTTGEKGLSILTLEFVQAVNQGKYWCEANNSVGWQKSLITKLSLSQGISCPSFHRCKSRKWIRS